MTETNVELARRGFEAALQGDLDAIGELLHPEVKWHAGDPSAEFACHNRAEALEFMRAGRFRNSSPELVDVVGVDDKVVVITRRSPAGEAPVLGANLTTFRDGKAIEMVHYPNAEDALAAAGIKP
jgi:ketosteroid isomerase-like protein